MDGRLALRVMSAADPQSAIFTSSERGELQLHIYRDTYDLSASTIRGIGRGVHYWANRHSRCSRSNVFR